MIGRNRYKEIYYEELAYNIMGDKKFHYLLSAIWRPRKAGSIIIMHEPKILERREPMV